MANPDPAPSVAIRYEVTVLVGPCSQRQVEALMFAIADLPECERIGGCVESRPFEEDEDA